MIDETMKMIESVRNILAKSILDASYSNWKNKLVFVIIKLIPPHYGINHGQDTIKFYSK